MTFQKELLTKYKSLPDVGNTRRAAISLGLSRTQLYNVEKEVNGFSDEVILKMAETLGLDTVETICRVHIENGSSPEIRQFWKQVLAEHKKLQELETKGKNGGEAA